MSYSVEFHHSPILPKSTPEIRRTVLIG
jgi:hypothetical protein